MAFFSKLKKLWKKDDEQPAVREEVHEQETSESTELTEQPVIAEPVPSPEPAVEIIEPVTEKEPSQWRDEVLAALQGAEPKLSIWLMHLLKGVEQAGPALWERLEFLFDQLEAPEDEARDFINRFKKWLDDMEYVRVEEFRSELQYRLALALDLEDEEDERSRLLLKLSTGLSKTREQLAHRIDQLLSLGGPFDDAFWEEFEEILIMADVGVTASQKLLQSLRTKVRKENIDTPEGFKELLKNELASMFSESVEKKVASPPEVVLMIGVNGVGKTTTIAKLAHRAQMQGKKVLLAAGDTFRAAAIEQLSIWAGRVGADFHAKEHGADPGAVAFEAMDTALSGKYDVIFMDTAGRLHTKVDLMDELKKIKRVMAKKHPGSPHRTVLVVDATTGQNALSQVKLFSEAITIDEVILTKLDGTAKGGMIVAIAMEYGLPISFIGLGEKMEDLRPFHGQDFANALLE